MKICTQLVTGCLTGVILASALSCSRLPAPVNASDRPSPDTSSAREVKTGRVLRVCADPNNLPFSNARQEGFENKLADLIAHELGAQVEYTWWAQRRGFFRNTVNARLCDVVMGVPSRIDFVDTTEPVYRSTYVFVSRTDRKLRLSSLDDPQLRRLTIGVHVIGDDYANTPPVHALARRNIVTNVVGYRLLDDYSQETPPARLIEAVATGKVDVAIVWGPLAGYFADRGSVALTLKAVTPAIDQGRLPFAYDISLGLRRGEPEFKSELNAILKQKRKQIAQLLREYRFPTVRRREQRP